MDISSHISKRIEECREKHADYKHWLSKLRLPNTILVGCGSLLAFLGGSAIIADVGSGVIAGALAILGGAMTGLHSWFGCEAHQTECRKIMGQFESLQSRFEYLLAEPDESKRLEKFRELESELSQVKLEKRAYPWKGFLDYGPKT